MSEGPEELLSVTMTKKEAVELNSAMIDGAQALLLSGNEAAADNLDRRRMTFNAKAGLTEIREATAQPASEGAKIKADADRNIFRTRV